MNEPIGQPNQSTPQEKNNVLLIVLIVVGCILIFTGIIAFFAVSYFGVLNPSKFLPDKCIFGSGFGGCLEVMYSDNTLRFALVNNVGSPITINSVNIQSSACQSPNINFGDAAWNSNERKDFTVTGCSVKRGDRLSSRIELNYISANSGLPRTVEGEITVLAN